MDNNCIDVAKDAVYVGKDYLVPCIAPERCKTQGCYWRQFHGLPGDKFCRRETQGDLEL